MKIVSNRVKWTLAVAMVCAGLFASRGASAACQNDPDCPGTACGDQVCDYGKGFTCQPAGVAAKGMDGWCTTDNDCKCKSLGAVCMGGTYCSFTTPAQAPGATATGGASGQTGGASGSTGGASAKTGGASGSTGGSSGSTGGSSGTDAGTTTTKDSGGCAIAGSASSAGLGGLLALAALVGFRRRRNRA